MPTQKHSTANPKPAQTSVTDLMTLARESAAAYKSVSHRSWFEKLSATNPKVANDLHAMAVDWSKGGETRTLFPELTSFHRFVVARVLRVSYGMFRDWITRISSEVTSGS